VVQHLHKILLWSYVSPQFAIADQISAGLYIASIWVEQDSNKTVTFTAKLYKRDSGGTETELVETSTSDTVTKNTKTQVIMSGFIENDISINSTDRAVLKIYSNVSGGGGAPNITIYMEGTDDSRVAVRVPTSVITKKIFDADGDTSVTVEETADEDKIHFRTAGTKQMTISDNGIITLFNQGAVRTKKTADQNLSVAGTWYTLTMTDLIDPQNQWDGPNNKFVAKEDGVYLIYAKVRFKVNSDGDRLSIKIYNITSSSTVAITTQRASTASTQDVMVMDVLSLSANDEIQFEVRNDSNTDTIEGGVDYATYAFIVKVS